MRLSLATPSQKGHPRYWQNRWLVWHQKRGNQRRQMVAGETRVVAQFPPKHEAGMAVLTMNMAITGGSFTEDDTGFFLLSTDDPGSQNLSVIRANLPKFAGSIAVMRRLSLADIRTVCIASSENCRLSGIAK